MAIKCIMKLVLHIVLLLNFVPGIISAQDSGTFKDARDGKEYKWVRIGEQIWMAENLDYEPDYNRGTTGTCPEEGVYRCEDELAPEKCGAFYDWAMAMDFVDGHWPDKDYCKIPVPTGLINTPKHRGIAPEGWHIPTKQEAQELINNYQSSAFNSYPADYVGVG